MRCRGEVIQDSSSFWSDASFVLPLRQTSRHRRFAAPEVGLVGSEMPPGAPIGPWEAALIPTFSAICSNFALAGLEAFDWLPFWTSRFLSREGVPVGESEGEPMGLVSNGGDAGGLDIPSSEPS